MQHRGAGYFFVSMLFFMGAAFGYFILSPLSTQFLIQLIIGSEGILNEFDSFILREGHADAMLV